MTKDEVIQLLLTIKATYPNHFNRIEDERTQKLALEMWYSAFKDQDFVTVIKCAQKHILQSSFPPSIAELREGVIKVTNPNSLISPEEAWETVILAIKKYGYYQQSEAFATFSEPIRRAVKAIGWQDICQSENISFERAHFLKIFKDFNQDSREEALFPKQIYDKLQRMTNDHRLEQKKDENGLSEM